MRPSVPLLALCFILSAPSVLAQGTLEVGGEGSVVFLFPADSVLVSVSGEDAARVAVRFGPDQGADLYPGDLVTGFNGTAVANGQSLNEQYRALEVGDEVRLSVERDGAAHEVVFDKPARPTGALAVAPRPEQVAAARALRGWGGTALATADEAAEWVSAPDNPRPGGVHQPATAEHDPVNGTVVFAGDSSRNMLRFEAPEPLDVHRRTGLRLRAKGQRDIYHLRLTDTAGRVASARFETNGRWSVHELAFDAFEGDALELAALASIELIPDAGPFRIELDAVEPY